MSNSPKILIAGGGIGGLVLALTLHQIGVQCTVFEAVPKLKPLGVGINLQPNAMRELLDLGFRSTDMDAIGVPSQEWALVGNQGQEIYAEPRGTHAGYKWPQYAAHRGQFHMALYHRLVSLAGPEIVQLGHRAKGYETQADGSVTAIFETSDGEVRHNGTLLIGADGIHSAIRQHMHPDQPPIHWGGALLWRGTSLAKPVRTGSSFVGLGNHAQRMIIYPISHPDPKSGLALINWIAEITLADTSAYKAMGWYRQVAVEDFIHHFEDWTYDWLDVPNLIRSTDAVYETPMIDRDPVDTWVDGPVALMGDAAHAMYPTGSNGASQAIMDARILGTTLLKYGVTPEALDAYNQDLCGPISALILRNRGAGPFELLNLVNERCAGIFETIDDVVSTAERNNLMAKYKAAAGFARDTLNNAPPTIPSGARVAQ